MNAMRTMTRRSIVQLVIRLMFFWYALKGLGFLLAPVAMALFSALYSDSRTVADMGSVWFRPLCSVATAWIWFGVWFFLWKIEGPLVRAVVPTGVDLGDDERFSTDDVLRLLIVCVGIFSLGAGLWGLPMFFLFIRELIHPTFTANPSVNMRIMGVSYVLRCLFGLMLILMPNFSLWCIMLFQKDGPVVDTDLEAEPLSYGF